MDRITTIGDNYAKNLYKMYALDKIVWDDDNGNIKRNDKIIDKMFNEIIKNDSWIIEDIGRKNLLKDSKKLI